MTFKKIISSKAEKQGELNNKTKLYGDVSMITLDVISTCLKARDFAK